MNLEDCRSKIDSIDKEMVRLFCERMDAAQNIAEYKKENNMNVYDSERERKLLDSVEENAGEKYGDYARRLYGSMLVLSRASQSGILNPPCEIS